MIKQLYLNNDTALIKPLGINGQVYKFTVHFLPKLESINSTTIECLGEECYICKILEWLKENNLIDLFKEKFKSFGTHFNIRKQNIYILPLYHFTLQKTWEFKYLRLFENQFINFVDFLEMNNLYKIGDFRNEDTIHIINEKWLLKFSKGSIPFINTDLIKLKSDYTNFINLLSNSENFKIVSDLTTLKAINYQFNSIIKLILKNL